MSENPVTWILSPQDADTIKRYLKEEIESLLYDADGTADNKLGFWYRIENELEIAIDHKNDK